MKVSSGKWRPSWPFIAFLQAIGLVVYCLLVGLVFWKGEVWFGKPPHLFLGPVMLLVLFVVSALISVLIVLGYPLVLLQLLQGEYPEPSCSGMSRSPRGAGVAKQAYRSLSAKPNLSFTV